LDQPATSQDPEDLNRLTFPAIISLFSLSFGILVFYHHFHPSHKIHHSPHTLKLQGDLQVLGFTEERAAKLYEEYASKKGQISFVECTQNWVKTLCEDAQDETEQWDTTMKNPGINSDIRVVFGKLEHSLIRTIQNLTEWLADVIETFHDALIDTNARILEELSTQPGMVKPRGGAQDEYTVPETPGGLLAVFKSFEIRRAHGPIIAHFRR
jgi:hypothetical protein